MSRVLGAWSAWHTVVTSSHSISLGHGRGPEPRMENRFSVVGFVKAHCSALLLSVVIIEMISSPAADYHPWVGAILAATMWVILLAAASALANRKIVRRLILPIAALWLVARALEAFGVHRHFCARAAPVMGLALSCAILWAIFDRARTTPRSSSAAIAEALSVTC